MIKVWFLNNTTLFSRYPKIKPGEKRQAFHVLFQLTTGRKKALFSVNGGRRANKTTVNNTSSQ